MAIRLLQREQEDIRRKIIEENRGLTWDDTRSMPLTQRVNIIVDFFIIFILLNKKGKKGSLLKLKSHHLIRILLYTSGGRDYQVTWDKLNCLHRFIWWILKNWKAKHQNYASTIRVNITLLKYTVPVYLCNVIGYVQSGGYNKILTIKYFLFNWITLFCRNVAPISFSRKDVIQLFFTKVAYIQTITCSGTINEIHRHMARMLINLPTSKCPLQHHNYDACHYISSM